MLRRGLKRKAAEEASESEMHLRNFQSATRKRESMRIKNATVSNNPGALEKHLKEKIAVEKKMIEGAAKLLMSCRNKSQTLEPAKTLLIARLRSDMLKFELNKLRRGRGSPAAAAQQGKPSHAGVSVRALCNKSRQFEIHTTFYMDITEAIFNSLLLALIPDFSSRT